MKLLISQYIPIANLIAKTIGEDCEVVLHDLEDPEHSVVYTVNNTVTGRMVGQSFNQLVPRVLLDKNLKDGLVTNYYFHTPQGKLIKSSTALIKDFDGVVVGAICINIDTTRIRQHLNWISEMLPDLDDTQKVEGVARPAVPDAHVSEIVDNLIDKVMEGQDTARMSRREKVALIETMEQKGVFLMKGAIERVAEKMGISKVTMYSYIDGIRPKG